MSDGLERLHCLFRRKKKRERKKERKKKRERRKERKTKKERTIVLFVRVARLLK